ncbi:beta-ketoacyl synthase chain length factor [Methylococcus capsulatus]|uniref:beta-ketoacyl synthase chain length factor n=1 Tax=Methylococcus capsulatus TaxID=414 RepID=UPI001C529021|nr:beta-ketoacyl synthase chain length factor [Methylococcus capsulatus]QXP88323.1 beta-ketoacyl synthase chain length factor [Methylococcus capsulatus]QXP94669.1 beta-ketoacyl synthase chain length factor [Methylococcus capsulatus]UQN13362.1 beta-ketoacyl synthase chain length factor [Methylococcus capsulatus]
MTLLQCHIEGLGAIGPGFADAEEFRRLVEAGRVDPSAPTPVPPPVCLPAAERRRAGTSIKLALAAGLQALEGSGRDPATLPTVFASSGGDGDNCHIICEALASNDRQISPTRFHNSVHNAPSGYWGIALGATAPSTSLCAFDASFGAGLLEAMVQVAQSREPCLLIAYDVPYPFPLGRVRAIGGAMGLALALAPDATVRSHARLTVGLGEEPCTELGDPGLEAMRRSIPAGRGLPLLRALALSEPCRVTVDYLDPLRLELEVAPCR